MIALLLGWLRTWCGVMGTRRRLRHLDDHLLGDIGIDRAGIDAFARVAMRAQQHGCPRPWELEETAEPCTSTV